MNLRSEALKRATLMLTAVGYEFQIQLKGEVVADTLPKPKRDMNRFAAYKDEILAVINAPEGECGKIFRKPDCDLPLSKITSNVAARCVERHGKGSVMLALNKEEDCVEWLRLPPKGDE